MFDTTRPYTRNLITTDHETFTLLLLCWNPGRESPIHDHPCDGCWVKVLQGQVQECRYDDYDPEENITPSSASASNEFPMKTLQCISDEIYKGGELSYITDSMGYHKVGNPSGTIPAVSMHLYSPPFQNCRTWADETSAPKESCSSHYSEYGKLVE